ncbi:MAG: ATP-binding protein [Fibrobacterota bacterium]
MASVCVYVGTYYLILYTRRRNEKEALTFAFTCFSVALYDICCAAGLYCATSLAEGVKWQVGQNASVCLIAISILGFTKDFTKSKVGIVDKLAMLYYGAMLLVVMTVSNELTLTVAKPAIKTLSFGHSKIIYYECSIGILLTLMFAVGILLFAYLIYQLIRYHRSAPNQKVIPMICSFFLLYLAFINDALVGERVYAFVYLTEYAFMGIVLTMGYVLQDRFINIQKEVEMLNVCLEKKVEERTRELTRSNNELEQFAYVASHDLQEPLRMVSSYMQLLEKRNKDKLDSDSKEFIGFAVDGAKRMKRLINDLLTYSRVNTNGKSFEPVECDHVFETAIKNLEIAVQEKKAHVTHDPLPNVMADEGQLIQLFQNLIGNALKFCKERTPEIHVSAKQKAKIWVMGIHDNGIGIASEHFERIFQIFKRLHTREEYEGTGIGLSVCKKIVERHGGEIWVESEIGKGTTFWFTISVLQIV